jgi:hypothetical protein
MPLGLPPSSAQDVGLAILRTEILASAIPHICLPSASLKRIFSHAQGHAFAYLHASEQTAFMVSDVGRSNARLFAYSPASPRTGARPWQPR